MNFQDLKTVKLGNAGEKIVDEYLRGKGVIPYAPISDGAHPFDRLCAYGKRRVFIAEAKTKPKRKLYPDTGIDVRHYNEYKFIEEKHNLDVWLFFVDSDEQRVYGNKLSELDKDTKIRHRGKMIPYPLEQGGIVYFPIQNTKHIANISNTELADLKKHSSRSEKYENA